MFLTYIYTYYIYIDNLTFALVVNVLKENVWNNYSADISGSVGCRQRLQTVHVDIVLHCSAWRLSYISILLYMFTYAYIYTSI